MDAAAWTMMIVTCAGAIAAAVVSVINALRTPPGVVTVEKKVDDVHTIVNNQRTAMMAEIDTLKGMVHRLVGEREDKARGKTLMETASDAAEGLLDKAKGVAKDLEAGVEEVVPDVRPKMYPPAGWVPPPRPKGEQS